jgi:hypothetical protein
MDDDNNTFTASTTDADGGSVKRRILLERLISSLMCKEGSAVRDAAADDDDRDVIEKIAKERMALTKDQLSAVSTSTEPLLIVLLDVLLLRLLDEMEKGRELLSSDVASDQQCLMDYDAAAAKKKKKMAAAAARKKRNKRKKTARQA